MPDVDGTMPVFSAADGIVTRERVDNGVRSSWFRADQTRLGRDVAVKCLRRDLAESVIFADAFLDAGRQAAAIVHPAALSIINVYPKQHCIAMHWCRGKSLKHMAAPPDTVTLANIGLVVLDCLSSLHATGRSHGNLSPGNIFLDDAGGVWVDDFFQPPLMFDGERDFSVDKRFIAPEVLAPGNAGWQADIFSLGCVMQECLAGSECSREFRSLLETMRALSPSRRGDSPSGIVKALRRVKAAEEVRLGITVDSTRRQRMYRRVPGEFDVSLRRRSASPGETAVLLNRIRDIGESGVFVETDDEFIRVGTILELDFALKGVEGNVHAFGVVRWKSTPPMPKGVGVQFMEVDQEGLAKLRRFLASRSSRIMPR